MLSASLEAKKALQDPRDMTRAKTTCGGGERELELMCDFLNMTGASVVFFPQDVRAASVKRR